MNIHTSTSTYNYHYRWTPPHSAGCPSASAVSAPMAAWKSTTSASCRGWYHHVCKWTICTSGWRKKDLQCKLQLMTNTTCASGMLPSVDRRETPQAKVQRSGCKLQRSGPASALVGTGCRTTYNYNHHHHRPDRTSTQCSNQCNLCEGPPFPLQT